MCDIVYRRLSFCFLRCALRGFLSVAIIFFASLDFASNLWAQAVYIEDAVRYGTPNGAITPRAGALGLSYSGISDDYAALYANPAGLTMLPYAEASASLQLDLHNSFAMHFGTTTPYNQSSFFLGHLGVAFPVRTGEAGSFTIALGFSRDADFTGGDSISGFNTATSLINSWVLGQRTGVLDGNPAFELALADVVGGRFITPLRNNLQQNVGIAERGALNNLSVGLGVDVTRNISLGVSFIGVFGSYNYRRIFRESDVQNLYTRLDSRNLTDIDFDRMTSVDIIEHNLSGSRLVLGAQMRIEDNVRANASFTLPIAFRVVEQLSSAHSAFFDNGDSRFYSPNDPTPTVINFTLPWSLNVGFSGHFSGLTVAASGEISDFSSVSAAGNVVDAAAIRQAVSALLALQLKVGVGLEYEIPNRPFVLRGSYSYIGSPYSQEEIGGAASFIGAGAGYYVAPNARFDFMYRLRLRASNILLYDGAFYSSLQALSQAALQFVVRF
jgi:long-subunit fatty acid transport protein